MPLGHSAGDPLGVEDRDHSAARLHPTRGTSVSNMPGRFGRRRGGTSSGVLTADRQGRAHAEHAADGALSRRRRLTVLRGRGRCRAARRAIGRRRCRSEHARPDGSSASWRWRATHYENVCLRERHARCVHWCTSQVTPRSAPRFDRPCCRSTTRSTRSLGSGPGDPSRTGSSALVAGDVSLLASVLGLHVTRGRGGPARAARVQVTLVLPARRIEHPGRHGPLPTSRRRRAGAAGGRRGSRRARRSAASMDEGCSGTRRI